MVELGDSPLTEHCEDRVQHISETTKTIGDMFAVAITVAGWLTSIIPVLASAVTLAWGVIRIYEWRQAKKRGTFDDKQLN